MAVEQRISSVENIGVSNLDDPVKTFIESIPKVPYNTLEQDLDLGRKIELMRLAKKALLNSNKTGINEDERELLEMRISEGRAAVEQITIPCLNMVLGVAMRKYKPEKGIPLIELINEGNTKLIEAAEKYDYRRGFKFITYATTSVQRRIKTYIDNESIIHLSMALSAMAPYVNAKGYQYLEEHGEWPTDKQLSKIANIPEEKIKAILNNGRIQPVSLDSPQRSTHNDGNERDLIDGLQDPSSPEPELEAERRYLRMIIEEAFAKGVLTEREIEIMRLRCGLNEDGLTYTLEEVGQLLRNNSTGEMGITRERVRQHEASAKIKLCDLIDKRNVEEYLEF